MLKKEQIKQRTETSNHVNAHDEYARSISTHMPKQDVAGMAWWLTSDSMHTVCCALYRSAGARKFYFQTHKRWDEMQQSSSCKLFSATVKEWHADMRLRNWFDFEILSPFVCFCFSAETSRWGSYFGTVWPW